MDFSNTDFSSTDVAAFSAEVFHSCEGEFAEITVFDARGDEGHGDVALDTINSGPRGNEGEDTGDEID